MQKAVSFITSSCKTLLDKINAANAVFFFVLLHLYIISNIMYMIGWQKDLLNVIWRIHQVLFAAVMWGGAIYLFVILVEWRNVWNDTKQLILIGIIVYALTGIISKIVTTDSYAFIMGVYFCLMASGKNYIKILYCFLLLLIGTLLFGAAGLKLGITFDAAKPERVFGGHSLGILYPNNWGFLVFAVLIILWYMFLKGKKLLTLVAFWTMAVFMYKYITCMTIAIMAVLFPVFGILAEAVQERVIKKSEAVMSRDNVYSRLFQGFIIALPFVFFSVMMFFCWKMDWVHDTFYNTPVHTMAMRFVEGGYSLRLNGVTLFGQPFQQWNQSLIEYANEIEMIVDSAFVCYLIIRGVVAMFLTLGWIAFAHHRCLQRKDYRLIVISSFMLLFSMMERPGLDAWYNFVLLYPLAEPMLSRVSVSD